MSIKAITSEDVMEALERHVAPLKEKLERFQRSVCFDPSNGDWMIGGCCYSGLQITVYRDPSVTGNRERYEVRLVFDHDELPKVFADAVRRPIVDLPIPLHVEMTCAARAMAEAASVMAEAVRGMKRA